MQERGLGATSLLAALQLCESRHPGSIVVRRGRSGRTTISVCNELLDSIEIQKHCYMKGHNRLRDLLINTRPHWDRDGTRPAVRSAFAKRCGAKLRNSVPRFSLPSMKNRFSVTPASPGHVQVAVIVPQCDGNASGGPHYLTCHTKGLRSPCRMYFGLYSTTTLTSPRRSPL